MINIASVCIGRIDLKFIKLIIFSSFALDISFGADAENPGVEAIECWVQNLRNRREDVGAQNFRHQALLESYELLLKQIEEENLKNGSNKKE